MKPTDNAVENWAKLVSSKPVRFLSEDEAHSYITFSLLEKDKSSNIDQLIKDLESKNMGYASVLWLRIKHCHTYKISPALCAWLGIFLIKNFGESTMIANYFQYVAHTHKLKTITCNDFGFHCFPHGVPTEESWQELWNAQKVDLEIRRATNYLNPDNILDYTNTINSIRDIN